MSVVAPVWFRFTDLSLQIDPLLFKKIQFLLQRGSFQKKNAAFFVHTGVRMAERIGVHEGGQGREA